MSGFKILLTTVLLIGYSNFRGETQNSEGEAGSDAYMKPRSGLNHYIAAASTALLKLVAFIFRASAYFAFFLGVVTWFALLAGYFWLSAPQGELTLYKEHRWDIIGTVFGSMLVGYFGIPDLGELEYGKLLALLLIPGLLFMRIEHREEADKKKEIENRKKDLLDIKVGEASVNGEKVSDVSARQALNTVNAFIHRDELAISEIDKWKKAAKDEYIEKHAVRLAIGLFLGAFLHSIISGASHLTNH